jgi:hypothetical protein
MILPNDNGKSLIASPEFVCRMSAPSKSWMYIAALVIAQSTGKVSGLAESWEEYATGNPCFHRGDVNSVIAMIRQKNV